MVLPLTIEQLQANIGSSSLTGEALERVANAAWDEIVGRFGEPVDRVEEHIAHHRPSRWVILHRRAATVSLVEERSSGSEAWVTTDAADYGLTDGGNTLYHETRGWSPWVRVTYDTADASVWIGVLIDLMLLRLPQSGWRAQDDSPEDPWGNPTLGGAVTGPGGTMAVAQSSVAARDLERSILDRLKPRGIAVA